MKMNSKQFLILKIGLNSSSFKKNLSVNSLYLSYLPIFPIIIIIVCIIGIMNIKNSEIVGRYRSIVVSYFGTFCNLRSGLSRPRGKENDEMKPSWHFWMRCSCVDGTIYSAAKDPEVIGSGWRLCKGILYKTEGRLLVKVADQRHWMRDLCQLFNLR